MPSINVPLQGGSPIFTVLIGVSVPRSAALKTAGLVVPQFVSAQMLLDTGATSTCIDPELLHGLDLPKIGEVNIATPSTKPGEFHRCDLYDASIYIPAGTDGFYISTIPIMTSHFRSQGIDGLIGRDVINRCTLIYNGSAGICTLCF